TYSAENLALAGTVTITNTGSRAAEYTLTIAPGPASSPALPAAVQIAAAPMAGALDCSPGATLNGARTGTLATGLTLRRELGAGATATAAVQTSPTPAAHATPRRRPRRPGGGAMHCLQGGAWEVPLGFPPEEGEKGRHPVKDRMFLPPGGSPDERIELTSQPTDGWYTVVHLRNTSSEVTQLVTSNSGGYGNAWLYVEKKLPGRSGWEPAAQGTFHTTPTVPGAGDVTGVHCGWQQ